MSTSRFKAPISHTHARTAWATPLLLESELQQCNLRLPFPSDEKWYIGFPSLTYNDSIQESHKCSCGAAKDDPNVSQSF